jgi:hypothetical protein
MVANPKASVILVWVGIQDAEHHHVRALPNPALAMS